MATQKEKSPKAWLVKVSLLHVGADGYGPAQHWYASAKTGDEAVAAVKKKAKIDTYEDGYKFEVFEAGFKPLTVLGLKEGKAMQWI